MGYRSQVAGCISVDSYTKESEQDRAKFREMVGFIKLSRFYEVWTVHNPETPDAFGWADGCFVLYGSDWKWYESYDDVQAWNELWESMQEIEGISGYFCRVGEEANDIEEHEFGSDPCYEHFRPYTGIDFEGEYYLGKRDTDVEENKTDQAPTDQEKESCGGSVAQSA